MNYFRCLKRAAAHIGPISHFRTQGGSLSDLINNKLSEDDDEYVIAAKVVEYFCVEDGVYNGFAIGIRLCVEFLADIHDIPHEHLERAILDLRQVIAESPTRDPLTQWARSHFS